MVRLKKILIYHEPGTAVSGNCGNCTLARGPRSTFESEGGGGGVGVVMIHGSVRGGVGEVSEKTTPEEKK